MSDKNQCPICLCVFASSQRLQSHLKRKIPCKVIQQPPQTPKLTVKYKNPTLLKNNIKIIEKKDVIESNRIESNEIVCQYCGRYFARKDNLTRHLNKNRCKISKEGLNEDDSDHEQFEPIKVYVSPKKTTELEEKVMMLEKQIAELREKPSNVVNNQILQVVCVGNNDNYLDMLTEHWGFDRALGFIKECALSNLTGDCKLIEKIYLTESMAQSAMRYIDKNKTKIEYFDENREKIVDNRGIVLGRKLANNLQNSYLKGVNYLITQNLSNNQCPNKFLEDYDLQTWNHHIYQLSDSRYQRKIVNQLNIPVAV